MKGHALALMVGTAAILSLSACNTKQNSNGPQDVQTASAQKAAGGKTIAAGLDQNSKFMAAAKIAGLDQTLAGPGPYTVFVPTDSAISSAPAGTFDAVPGNRAQLTGIITNMILPGTVLVADIDKGIDEHNGKDDLATFSGGKLTATKEGGKTVISDSAGHEAVITQGDQEFSNGVVHQVNAVLMPTNTPSTNSPAVGQKAGK